jgi:hypothetical protein
MFFRAKSPSMPNIFLVNQEVFTCLAFSLISADCLIASTADTFALRFAGIRAENKIVIKAVKAAIIIEGIDTDNASGI